LNAMTRALLNLQTLEFEPRPPIRRTRTARAGVPRIQRLRSRVSAQVLREYDSRKRRYGARSLVPIRKDSCTGCQVRLSLRTRRRALERVTECEHCARLLYNPSRRRRLVMEI